MAGWDLVRFVAQIKAHTGWIEPICASEKHRMEIKTVECGLDGAVPLIRLRPDGDEFSTEFRR